MDGATQSKQRVSLFSSTPIQTIGIGVESTSQHKLAQSHSVKLAFIFPLVHFE